MSIFENYFRDEKSIHVTHFMYYTYTFDALYVLCKNPWRTLYIMPVRVEA